MKTRTIHDELKDHPFFAGLDPRYTEIISGCGKNVHFDEGAYLFREGDEAKGFYIIRDGAVALEFNTPEKGGLTIQTEGAGEVVGASWLFPPYRILLDGRAASNIRAIALDGECLRGKCDSDPEMGFELMKRFAGILVERLQAARMRLIDMYS